jgi:hypothetical protein
MNSSVSWIGHLHPCEGPVTVLLQEMWTFEFLLRFFRLLRFVAHRVTDPLMLRLRDCA